MIRTRSDIDPNPNPSQASPDASVTGDQSTGALRAGFLSPAAAAGGGSGGAGVIGATLTAPFSSATGSTFGAGAVSGAPGAIGWQAAKTSSKDRTSACLNPADALRESMGKA